MTKRPARTKLWQILKTDTNVNQELDDSLFDFAKNLDKKNWLKGYQQWKKQQQNYNGKN